MRRTARRWFAGSQRAASFASMMAMMTSSRLPSRAHQRVLEMEKPVAEPGAVVVGRIFRQAHDGVPQVGEAFRQILHVVGGFACAGPCFRQEPAGIGPAAGHGEWCDGVEHRVPPWVARQNGGDAGRIVLPRIARIASAVLPSASTCPNMRAGGSHQDTATTCSWPDYAERKVAGCKPVRPVQWVVSSRSAVMARAAMADQAFRSCPRRAFRRSQILSAS